EVVARSASGALRRWRELHENAPDLHAICEPPRLRMPWSTASEAGRLRCAGLPAKNRRSSAARNKAGSGETQSRCKKAGQIHNGSEAGEASVCSAKQAT